MRPPRIRFTIRWFMGVTAIVAIALWLNRFFSAATCFSIVSLCALHYYGLGPPRRL
jgi:hypothetical protein